MCFRSICSVYIYICVAPEVVPRLTDSDSRTLPSGRSPTMAIYAQQLSAAWREHNRWEKRERKRENRTRDMPHTANISLVIEFPAARDRPSPLRSDLSSVTPPPQSSSARDDPLGLYILRIYAFLSAALSCGLSLLFLLLLLPCGPFGAVLLIDSLRLRNFLMPKLRSTDCRAHLQDKRIGFFVLYFPRENNFIVYSCTQLDIYIPCRSCTINHKASETNGKFAGVELWRELLNLL